MFEPLDREEKSNVIVFPLETRNVDTILIYTYEKELGELIKANDFGIRFLGDDYVGKSYTGDDLGIPCLSKSTRS